MKNKLCLAIVASFLIACGGGGGGHNAGDGGFQKPIAPELNVSFAPNSILPNPSGSRVTALSRNAVADFTVYARQGNTPIENGDEELLISLNEAIGNVPGIIYCYEFGNDACVETIQDAAGNDIEVPRPLGKVQLDLAAGRGYFSVTAANGQLGDIGINVTVIGPNNSTVSKDIKIPVGYPTSGAPYQVNIISPDKIAPNTATDVIVSVTDEAGNPVNDPVSDNLIVTANNLPNTTIGFAGEVGQSVNAKTDTGLATISVLPRDEGYVTIVAQADSADNDVSDGFQKIVTAAKTIQVTSAYTPPTQNVAITTSLLPNGVVGVDYNDFALATTGSSVINFVLTAGSLPPGMSFNQGVLSGTPTLVGEYKFTVVATGANGSTATQELTLTVLQNGFQFDRTAFDSIEATRNLDPAVPDECWVGAQTLSLQALNGYTLEAPFIWKMDAGGVSTALGAGKNAVDVVTANGILLPDLEFTVTEDTTQVVMSGRVCPSAPSNVFSGHAIILSATDTNGFKFESVLPLVIGLKVNPYTPDPVEPTEPTTTEVTLISGTVGLEYNQSIAGATGTVTSGVLPPGLTYDAGVLKGTPTTQGTYTFTITNSATSLVKVTVKINDRGLTITPLTFGADEIPAPPADGNGSCLAVAKTFTVASVSPYVGQAPYSWQMDGGNVDYALNAGVSQQLITSDSVEITGLKIAVTEDTTQVVVSGKLCSSTIGDTGTFTGGHAIILRVTDANNTLQEVVFPYVVTQAKFTAADLSLPGGTQGASYSAVIPNAVSISAGTPPPGLSFSGGALTGTPSTAGEFSFTVKLANGGEQSVSVSIAEPPAP